MKRISLFVLTFSIVLSGLFIFGKKHANKVEDNFPIIFSAPSKKVAPEDQIYGPNVQLYTYATAPISEAEELKDVQVPIPRNIRILNTKGNCVWCSLEVLAKYAEIKSLYGITNDVSQGGDPRCQGGSNPAPVRAFLQSKGIKFEMTTTGDESLLIKACKIDRRGAAFGIPGHMMNVVHYDPDTKIIKVIDNADRSLSVQTWSWEKFHRLWDGWAYYIVGEPDIISSKYVPLSSQIPIIDRNHPQGNYPAGYIPVPIND